MRLEATSGLSASTKYSGDGKWQRAKGDSGSGDTSAYVLSNIQVQSDITTYGIISNNKGDRCNFEAMNDWNDEKQKIICLFTDNIEENKLYYKINDILIFFILL